MSNDQRFILLRVPGFAAGAPQQIVSLDRTLGTARVVSTACDGTPGDKNSLNASISGDGTRVVFSSDATNLIGDETNAATDGYIDPPPPRG